MGCGTCGGAGFDPYAAHRSHTPRTSRGSSAGVLKSEKRLALEKDATLAQAKKEALIVKKAKAQAKAQQLPTYSPEIHKSGIIKSAKRLQRESGK
jgi:hypothetical protein